MRTVLVSAGICIETRRPSGGAPRGDPPRVLLTRRRAGTHLAGKWEFPGGKVGPEEDPRDALVRELREEVGIVVDVGRPVEVTWFRYPETTVLLLFFEVHRRPESPEPVALEVAEVRWAERAELDELTFPEADLPVLALVKAQLEATARSDVA